MTPKLVTIGVALVLTGCAQVVSGKPDMVSIDTAYSSPYLKAVEHCAKYEKTAKFKKVVAAETNWVFNGNLYTFECLKQIKSLPQTE